MKTPTIIFQNELVDTIPNHSLIGEGEWIQDDGVPVFVQYISINDEIYCKMVCGTIIQIWKKTQIKPAKSWFDGEASSIPNFPMKVVWEVNFPAINGGYIRNITDMNIKMDDQGEIVVRWKIETHKKSTDLGAANDYFQSFKEVFYNIEDLKEWLKEPLFYSNGSPQFRHEIDMSKLENLE